MKTHRSAKTNVYQRQLLIRRVRHQGWTQRQAAEAVGVSVRTVAKWLARNRRELADRSSRPHRQPRRLAATTEAAIVALRRTRATAWQIGAALAVPRSTVTRVLARCGLNRVAAGEPPAPVRRYEWPHAGDLLHVDVKRLGRIQGIGHRIHGDRRRRARRVGWEFLHVAVDDATRLAYVEVLAAQDAVTCAALPAACGPVVRAGRGAHSPVAHRQRLRVSRPRLRRRLSAVGDSAPLYAAVPSANEWQGRAIDSDVAVRVGLSHALPQLRATDRGAPTVSALLQPPASACEPRPTLAMDAFPRGCLMNNLFDIHI
jgi:transposase